MSRAQHSAKVWPDKHVGVCFSRRASAEPLAQLLLHGVPFATGFGFQTFALTVCKSLSSLRVGPRAANVLVRTRGEQRLDRVEWDQHHFIYASHTLQQ